MRMYKNKVMKAVLCTSLALFGTSVLAQGNDEEPNPEDQPKVEGPDKSQVNITNIVQTGPGCKAGTASILATNSTPNGGVDYFQVVYDDFILELPEGSTGKKAVAKKDCLTKISISHPAGFRFKLDSVEYSGYADVAPEANASFNTNYFFSSIDRDKRGGKINRERQPIPNEGDYEIRHVFGYENSKRQNKKLWSPCRKEDGAFNFNIHTTLSLKPDHKKTTSYDSTMTLDSKSAIVAGEKYKILWVNCKKKKGKKKF